MADLVQEASGSNVAISHLSTFEDKKSLPPIPTNSSNPQESRLWIGNLDSRITEYHLVKVLQKHGKVTKFDFLFHKTGPLQGQPKGYCFVTFETKEEAENALRELDGKLALSKKLSVKWAYLQSKLDDEGLKPANSLGPSAKSDDKSDESISAKIRAIEAKLKAMEENKDSDNIDRPELPIAITHPRAQPTQQRNRYRRRPYYRPAPSRSRRR